MIKLKEKLMSIIKIYFTINYMIKPEIFQIELSFKLNKLSYIILKERSLLKIREVQI